MSKNNEQHSEQQSNVVERFILHESSGLTTEAYIAFVINVILQWLSREKNCHRCITLCIFHYQQPFN